MKKDPSNIIKGLFNKNKSSNILDLYHGFMVTYGYIPFDEFKKMDSWLVGELTTRINEMNKKSGGKR